MWRTLSDLAQLIPDGDGVCGKKLLTKGHHACVISFRIRTLPPNSGVVRYPGYPYRQAEGRCVLRTDQPLGMET